MMDKNLKGKIEFCCKKLFAKDLKKVEDWNGYEVYEPIYDGEFIGGFPKIVLVKDGEARISTREECFAYINFVKGKEKK